MLYVTPVIAWCIVQDDFELMEIPLLEPPKCWDYRHMPSKLVGVSCEGACHWL